MRSSKDAPRVASPMGHFAMAPSRASALLIEACPQPNAPWNQKFPRNLRRRHDLTRVEDVLRIQRRFQCAHGVQRLGAKLRLQIFLLALADAMLAGAGAAHGLRTLDQPMHEFLAARHL